MALLQLGLGIGILLVLGAMVYIGIRRESGGDALEDRLAAFGDREVDVESLEEVELSLSFQDRILFPVIEKPADRKSVV